MPTANTLYRFADFTVNSTKQQLFQNGSELACKGRELDVLIFLIESSPAICSIDEIIEAVWVKTYVSNNSVEKIITGLRTILGDDKTSPRFIRTHRGKGYAFLCEVSQIEERKPATYDRDKTNVGNRSNPESPNFPDKSIGHYLKPVFALMTVLVVLLGVSWWKGGSYFATINAKTIFSDDFSGSDVDTQKWSVDGKTVGIENGVAKLSAEETDNWGRLHSIYFAFDLNKPITIKSRIKVSYSDSLKDKNYFHGCFLLSPKTSLVSEEAIKNTISFGVKYANYDFESKFPDGNTDEQKVEGFYLVKAGSDPAKRIDYEKGKISRRIKPVWNEWFEQAIVYDPANGEMSYLINDELKQKFNVGRFSTDLAENKLRLEIYPEGWWLYHSIEIDYISVTQ
jgi:DNA-binding winged helix-turn-helix (wHTH) protein